jgi:hypothetical protein
MPAATNLGLAKKGLSASVTSLGSLETVDEALAINILFDKTAADGAAGTTTTDTLVWVNPFSYPVYLVSAYGVATGAAIAASATDFVTITFRTRDGVGGASAAALTIVSDVAGGAWTQNVSKAITTLTRANAAVPVGGHITFSIAKAASGTVVPVSKFVVKAYKAES